MLNFSRKKKEQVWVNISNHTLIRAILWIVLAFIAFAALRKTTHALILIFTAFFLALALNSPVHWIAKHLPGKRHNRRVMATTVSFLLVVAIIAGFLIAITPPLIRNVNSFLQNVPQLVHEAESKGSTVSHFISKYHLQGQIDKFSHNLSGQFSNIPTTAVSTVGTVVSSIVSILAILALTFMMLVEGPYWVRRAKELMPKSRRAHANSIAADMYQVIRGYVNGQVLLAAIATAFITPALFILHISYPLALMGVVFICGLIPLVGHTIGAVIVTLVAVFHSPWSAIIILAYYIFYQQVENYLIQPKVQANTTNLSPLLVFIAVVIGVSFGGLFGGLVAIPAMGCLRVLVVDYLKEHGKLEDVNPLAEPPENL